MEHIFLSDVHLGAFNDEKNQHLENEIIRLIDYCEANHIQIHILGDFFDYWMEYPNYIPEIGKSVLDRFETYNDMMEKQTTYITGNHDSWTISHFEERGFKVEHEYVNLRLDENNVFLCHGDGLKEEIFQLPRPLMHRFIRHPRFVQFYKTVLNGRTGIQVMKSFSAFTKDEVVQPERLSNWATFMLKNFTFDVIISGHDHVPRMETFPGGTYINTGAFHRDKTVLRYNNGAFELVIWAEGNQQFQPFLKTA